MVPLVTILVLDSVNVSRGLLNSGPPGFRAPALSGQVFLGLSRAFVPIFFIIYFLFVFIFLLFRISGLFICLYVHFDACV